MQTKELTFKVVTPNGARVGQENLTLEQALKLLRTCLFLNEQMDKFIDFRIEIE